MGVQTLEGDYQEMALFRKREDMLKQEFTVNNQNTEDDLKLLLRILSMTNLYNYFSYTYSWLGLVCLDINTHKQSAHCNGLSSLLAIFFFNWKSTIQPTLTVWFFVFENLKISTTWCFDISTPAHYNTRNFPRSGDSTWKFNLPLYQRRLLETVWFGSSCKMWARGWVSGKNEERKRK